MPAFSLGVITDEISPDLEHALDVMLEYEVRQVELREFWGKNVLQHTDEDIERARKAIASRGMQVCSIASPFFKCSPPHFDADASAAEGAVERKLHGAAEVGLDGQMEILGRACQVAHLFGTRLIRVFAFWREVNMSPRLCSWMENAFREPLELAASEDVILGLENEHACLLGTGAETGKFLRSMNHPQLRCVWDPGNAFRGGERPFPNGYNEVKEFVTHVHVKDARLVQNPGGKTERPWTVVGEGDIGYFEHLSTLQQDGYSGVVSLETHYRDPRKGAEGSTRECLTALRSITRELT